MTAAPQVTVRPAEPGDSAMLAELGAKTFHDSFADHNDPADMAAYLKASFAPEIQAIDDAKFAKFIADPALAEWKVKLVKMRRLKPHTLSEPEERLLAKRIDRPSGENEHSAS